MSELGQKHTSNSPRSLSAVPSFASHLRMSMFGSFVPIADSFCPEIGWSYRAAISAPGRFLCR